MPMQLGWPKSTKALTVSQVNQLVRQALETSLAECWVVGEISNLRWPPSGHLYFSLKDTHAQIAAVMFRSAGQLLAFRPADGMAVIVHARVGIYEVRGALQLYVDTMEPRGLGAQQLALEQLKQRLAAEGLFAESRKRRLPFFPRAVGIVTALGGAAIHDLLVVLQARLPGVRAVLRPVRVQGKEAAPEIAAAISELNQLPYVEVLIVGRGGGSAEDLSAFNDERVARAIADSRAPVVSAVGHEIDFTIADLVADCRAPTPTAAAAMVVPDHADLQRGVQRLAAGLRQATLRQVYRRQDQLLARAQRLRDPRRVLAMLQQRLDELGERTARAINGHLRTRQLQLRGATERLQALSPLGVLHRGYSIARRVDDGAIVRNAAILVPGDRLHLTLAAGSAQVCVEQRYSE